MYWDILIFQLQIKRALSNPSQSYLQATLANKQHTEFLSTSKRDGGCVLHKQVLRLAIESLTLRYGIDPVRHTNEKPFSVGPLRWHLGQALDKVAAAGTFFVFLKFPLNSY